ncbi:MAG: hypothetical protein CVV10_03895 [Gammaproteobacteria bacterium HGW-Gammaproteobacteria-14]|nr:MAG: hypothetical protein CVV10_03895 [Gammaproteobacteria bacterium HGW-Gammaproteobacteria-14]
MKQTLFEQRFADDWKTFDTVLTRLESNQKKQPSNDDPEMARFPQHYRRLCHQQSLARERGYSLSLIQRLDDLVLRGHRQLYRHSLPMAAPLKQLFVYGFPQAVRDQWPWQLASLIAFCLPLLLVATLVTQVPEMIYSVLDVDSVHAMEQMYEPDAPHRLERNSSDDLVMFGFYIYNNIGIAFRTLAGGMFFGIGSLIVMVFNGSYFGAIAAHLVNVGSHEPFFTFVIAHGAPELTAIVLAGGAGLRIGWSLVAPGRHSRLDALKHSANRVMPIMYGVFAMLLLAAFIEAFWSPRLLEPQVKYLVGSLLWLVTLMYFTLAGRR